jgi:hypothetical protein
MEVLPSFVVFHDLLPTSPCIEYGFDFVLIL